MKLLRGLSGALSFALLLGLMVSSSPAGAQTLTAFTAERSVILTNVLTSLTPQVPAALLASIAGGALDIREQTNYNPAQNLLTSTIFVVPTGSPFPTNLAQLPASSIVAVVGLSVDRIYIVPAAKVAEFVGSYSSSTLTPYGSYQGLPGVYSFAYSGDTPPKISNVFESSAGTIVLFSPTATGSVTIVNPPSGPVVGPGSGVTVVVGGPGSAASTSFQTTLNQLNLDASKSTSSNPGALTYSWGVVAGYPSATINFGNTATPFIQLSSGKGIYQFSVTVTDATGANATAIITVQFI